MELSEAKRLKVLEDENRKLKRLLAEQVMDNAAHRCRFGYRRLHLHKKLFRIYRDERLTVRRAGASGP